MVRLYASFLFILLACLPATLQAAGTESQHKAWTIQEAVGFAHTHSPDAQAAMQRIANAEAFVQKSQAAFYPQVTLQAEYARTNNPMYSFGNILNQGAFNNSIDFNDPGETDDLQLKTAIHYSLYNGGEDQAGLAMAKLNTQARTLEHQAILATLDFHIIQAFYTIVQAQETVLARESSVEALGASLQVAQARYEEGDLLKQEVLNLEVQQSLARENLIQTQHGLEISKRNFLNLLGLTGDNPLLDLAGSIDQQPPSADQSWKRPELKAMEITLQSLEAGIRKAQSGYYPKAGAYGSYQVDQGFELDENGDSWFAGIRLDYTLFNGKRTASEVESARTRLAEAREQLRKLQLAINLEQEKAALSLQQAEKRLQVTGIMVESASESARLSRARFKEGVILSSDIIDTENRLTDAQVRRALAMAAKRIAIADLRRAYGADQFSNK
ncbi:TolC family protein [Desulfogranum japonicum]|uniref:TolC family protein n=1 Tax=Desulfogranum japonicum TaxID=231447 RepID=UPI0004188C22|nr:TolC family protein [Desulfogranum japonicum]